MERKVRVGLINYLNTRPLLYGLKRAPVADCIDLVEDYPAMLAQKLKAGSIDLGLIPVAAAKALPQFYINGSYCIGAVGDVASVCLFSDVPLAEIKTIYLDYQSRSSAALLKWLLSNYWHIKPRIQHAADETYLQEIKNDTAGLIIGDRALQFRGRTKYIYDLAGEWKAATGLPFVFAAWISTQPMDDDFIKKFDAANAYGLAHLQDVIAEAPTGIYDLQRYYAQDLSYNLDEAKRRGLDLFLKSI